MTWDCDVCEPRKCQFRSCFRPGEDKGSFVQGRGYVSYHKVPKKVCMTRHLHGCPLDLPEPDHEARRCCYRPSYQRRKEAPKGWRQCETCGVVNPRWAADILNGLPGLPGVSCRHEKAKNSMLVGWIECPICDGGCGGLWDHRPKPFEVPQKDKDWGYAELDRRLQNMEVVG
jgi:hypothetical protein